MKTIFAALLTLCLFTTAQAQYVANFSMGKHGEPMSASRTITNNDKIGKQNAAIKRHNQLAQQILIQHVAKEITYPEKLRELDAEGRVMVIIKLDKVGKIQEYTITQSPNPLFSREVERILNHAPAVVHNQTYLGARKLVLPIDFSIQ